MHLCNLRAQLGVYKAVGKTTIACARALAQGGATGELALGANACTDACRRALKAPPTGPVTRETLACMGESPREGGRERRDGTGDGGGAHIALLASRR